MKFEHLPVLAEQTIENLAIFPEGIYIDGTAGGGGHSELIAKQLTTGRLLCIDQDPDAVKAATERLQKYDCFCMVKANFADMTEAAHSVGITGADGVLLDIGVSSHQLDTPERGFSYHTDAPLDMRMSQSGLTAADLVNGCDVYELAKIISTYGEEKFAMQIARAIEKYRQTEPITTTAQLAEIIKNAVPAAVRREGGHPARKTFQALRIAVNGELDRLKEGMQAAFDLLNIGGRLAIITFHSLEDRIVKNAFRKAENPCECPSGLPCVCGKKPLGKVVSRKPIIPSDQEMEENPRSKSSKLRVFERI